MQYSGESDVLSPEAAFCMREYEILVADPAKNITVFVLDSVENAAERTALARAILADKSLAAEQVGFVVPPGTGRGIWHLEMAGGEFCGNAARSFGLFVAGKQGLKERANVFVSVSGANGPVDVDVDAEKSEAAAEMPKPHAVETLDYEGHTLALIIFEGITHVIAPGLVAKSEAFYAIKSLAERKLSQLGGKLPSAIGVMFYNMADVFMIPAVYVRSTDSLVFESSCGSGSAALGLWLSRELTDGSVRYAVAQPGGVIETEVIKEAGKIAGIKIGGELKLGEPQKFFLN